ncbi:MAG: hypothetical protein IJ695_08245, partial [Butyrivibrio sp.]|nr:hypothetical protein [Butyrivibrio sp.]
IRYNPVVTWGEWPSWTKGSAYPVVTYTVKYTSANTGKTETDPTTYTAKVTSDPETITDKTDKVTFTATTDLTGFFADKAGTKAATNDTSTKFFMFDNDGKAIDSKEASDDESGIVVVGLKDEYDFTGGKIMPAFDVYDSNGPWLLAKGTDYTLTFKDNTKVGTASITINGKGNYTGKSLVVNFKIVDKRAEMTADEIAALDEIKGLTVVNKKYTYTGSEIYPTQIKIKNTSGETTYNLVEGSDGNYESADSNAAAPSAVITFSNNVNAGTAKITVTGRNNNKGNATTKSASYTIAKAKLVLGSDGKNLEVTVDPEELEWQVKGAKPSVTATWNGIDLAPNQDYTVSYVKNTKVGDAGTSVKITGKNNFTGTVANAATFKVQALDLAGEKVGIVSTTAAAGIKGSSVKVTVMDDAGDIVPTSKYKVTVKDSEGNVVTAALADDTDYTIEVTRKKDNIAELNGEVLTKDIHTGANFSKASTKLLNKYQETYTGEYITYENDEEFDKIYAVTLGVTTLHCGEDFEIVGYTNNLNKGTMKLTLNGIGKYSGTKTVSIKIVAKKLTK